MYGTCSLAKSECVYLKKKIRHILLPKYCEHPFSWCSLCSGVSPLAVCRFAAARSRSTRCGYLAAGCACSPSPNQSSVPKAWREFDDEGCMKPSAWYDRIVDVAEELFKMTLLLKGYTGYLSDNYRERKESHQELFARVNQAKI